ncbi:DUF3098 domain-containing protein [Runella sp.]|jgi:hypothetical protein|uniref:DUF3098 domain-containing protein n=1 Tax=Runella sp. TaxID=1960881 RepID=UPI00263999C3|nr:DUF3098 domain-containing protein [Runella sp.]
MKKNALPFSKSNFTFMIIGIVLILGGFVIMSMDSAEFGFGVLGLTVGPLVVMSGFVVEFFAILRKPASTEK